MKSFNFKSWYQSPRFQKWGLYGLLAVSLGFNLSMNPEHFNNIARFEKGSPLQSYELAQTAPPAATPPAVVPAAPAVAPTPAVVADAQKKENQRFIVSGKLGSFEANITEVSVGSEKVALVKFKRLGEAVGACELCSAKPMPLKSSGNLSDLTNELLAIVNGKSDVSTPEAVVAEIVKTCPMDMAKKPKAGEVSEMTDEQIAACASKCDKVKDSEKLSCHRARLVEISKLLKNHSEQSSYVLKYFKDYLHSELRIGMTAPTVREGPFDCGGGFTGRPVYMTRYGAGCLDTSNLEKAGDITKELLSQLKSSNGKSTIEALLSLEAASFAAQTRNAQVIGNQGLKQNNPEKMAFGANYANPMYLEGVLAATYGDLAGIIQTRADSGLQHSFMTNLDNMQARVSGYLTQMQSCGQQNNQNIPNSNFQNPNMPNQNNQFVPTQGSNIAGCKTYMDFQVPNLDGMSGIAPYLPGASGNLANMFARTRGQVPPEWLMKGLTNNNFQGQPQPSVVPQALNPNGAPNTANTGRVSGRNGSQW